MTHDPLLGLSLILGLGVGAQWLAWRARVPSILVLLLAGFVAGPVLGWLDPDALLGEALFPVVSLAVAVILFEGGLTLRFRELGDIGDVVTRLISLGLVITWAVAAFVVGGALGLSPGLAVLQGAIVTVTGPTVVGPLLRLVRPTGPAGRVLKWEGILIDPVGATLAVLTFEILREGSFANAGGQVVTGLVRTVGVGVGIGLACAGLLVLLLRRYLIPDHLQGGVALLFVAGAFTGSNLLQAEAGLLTVTVMGVVLANQRRVSVQPIVDFKENLQVLLIGALFIVLSARLELAELSGLGWRSLALPAALILVARPLGVWASTIGSALTWRDRVLVAWVAPRGIVAAAVASLFAFELGESGLAGAERLVPLTFVTIAVTVAFYGLTAGPVARALGLSESSPQGVLILGAHPLGRALARAVREAGFRALLVDSNRTMVQAARREGLEAHHGNALDEAVLEDLDLSGIGRLLAVTSNDEANALSALRFRVVFGHAGVYQLPPLDAAQRQVPRELRGRYLFARDATYERLTAALAAGGRIASTTAAEHQADAVALLAVDGGRLRVVSTDDPLTQRAGTTLIRLAPADDAPPDAAPAGARPAGGRAAAPEGGTRAPTPPPAPGAP